MLLALLASAHLAVPTGFDFPSWPPVATPPRWDAGPLAFPSASDDVPPPGERLQHDDLVAGGFALFEQANREAGATSNSIFSPYVVQTVMAPVFAGAAGDTADQLATALSWRQSPAEVLRGMAALERRLAAQVERERAARPGAARRPAGGASWLSDGLRLDVASRLWPREGVVLEPDFCTAVYDSGISVDGQTLDFAADVEAARQAINRWTAERTSNTIPELLPEGWVDPRTELVLTAAMYFRGAWQKTFAPLNAGRFSFAPAGGAPTPTPGMTVTTGLPILKTDSFTAVDVPYGGGNFSMLVVLPHAGSRGGVPEITFTPADYARFFAEAHTSEVKLTMPSFTLRQSLDLVETFKHLGLLDAFAPNRADFKRMFRRRPNGANVFIYAIQKEAFVEVTPEGTRAGAAAAVGMMSFCARVTPEPFVVDVDRPFLFVIHDRETRTPLFLGRLMDPASAL